MKTINLDTYFMKTASHLNGTPDPLDPNDYAALLAIDGEDVTLEGTTGGVDAYSDVESWNSNNDYDKSARKPTTSVVG